MKTRIFILFLIAVMTLSMSACSPAAARGHLDTVEGRIEHRVDRMEDSIEQALTPAASANTPTAPATALTAEEAAAIALEHAGFTADQVSRLRTEYEVDDGVAHYEVTFRQGRWEYDYEINADTGAILSYDRDD